MSLPTDSDIESESNSDHRPPVLGLGQQHTIIPFLKKVLNELSNLSPAQQQKLREVKQTLEKTLTVEQNGSASTQGGGVSKRSSNITIEVPDRRLPATVSVAQATSQRDHGVHERQRIKGQDSGDGTDVSRSSIYEKQRAKNEVEVYRMENNPRGITLIISNIKFDHPECTTRLESKEHSKELKKLFKNFLFSVDLHEDLTGKAMLETLKCTSRHLGLQDYDACVVVIMTHGTEGGLLFGTDIKKNEEGDLIEGTYITVEDLMTIFGGYQCPKMKGKPKLFILQACRGGFEDRNLGRIDPERMFEANSQEDRPPYANPSRDGPTGGEDSRKSTQNDSSNLADMLFFFSSPKDYISYREYFIPHLVQVFKKSAHAKSLTEIHAEPSYDLDGAPTPRATVAAKAPRSVLTTAPGLH